MLFFESDGASLSTAKNILDQLKELQKNFGDYVIGADPTKVYKNVEKQVAEIADKAKVLQRTMGGVVVNSEKFASSLIESYKETVKIGASFTDITNTVQGLADSMQRMVLPSQKTVTAMVELSKATGMGATEVGKMVGELTRFGGTQLSATAKMHELAVEARKVGMDAKAFLTNVNANLKSLNGFGFGNSVKGLKDMVKQATLLRTSIDSIGASSLQSKVLDPEGAMQTAASFQMLGGAVGKLADPFQLLRMAQSDMKGLQDEILKSSASAFKFNKETGKFDASVEDTYRLREQANLLGKSLDEVMQVGREAAKANFLKERFGFANLSEDELNLVSGLSEIDSTGKVTIDIPGFGKIEEADLASADAQKALNDYMEKAGDSEKDIAISNLNIAETQAKDINLIKTAVLTQMGLADRATLISDITKLNQETGNKFTKAAEDIAPTVGDAVKGAAAAQSTLVSNIPSQPYEDEELANVADTLTKLKEKFASPTTLEDGFIPANGTAPVIMSQGQIYKGIVGDDVAVGTKLTEALNNAGGGGGGITNNVGGKIDININLSGNIDGDGGQLTKMFNSPQIQKQIMDTVLYKLNDYKRQQGVIS